MKIKTVSTARFLLFLIGGCLLTTASWILIPDSKTIGIRLFIVIATLLTYIALAWPLAFSFEVNNGILVGGVIYYRGAAIFGAATVFLILRALRMPKLTKLQVILELVALFGFAIYVMLSFEAAKHVEKVKQNEDKKTEALNILKADAVKLLQIAESFKFDDPSVKQAISKLAEDIRYLSPSSNPAAVDLEWKLDEMINSINLWNVSEMQLQQLDFLYRQRKALY